MKEVIVEGGGSLERERRMESLLGGGIAVQEVGGVWRSGERIGECGWGRGGER